MLLMEKISLSTLASGVCGCHPKRKGTGAVELGNCTPEAYHKSTVALSLKKKNLKFFNFKMFLI